MYHSGWGWAGSAPYKGTKLLASHFGGTRNPMAVRWPAKIKPDATPRAQFHHCNDVVPTIYEVDGLTPPRVVHGIPQDPIDGVSLAYTFGDATAQGRLRTQYFEVMGSRAIYHDGWMASAFGPHRMTHADAEKESARIRLGKSACAVRHRHRVARPEARDAGRDREPFRRRQQQAGVRKGFLGAEPLGHP
jgi:arylsulfatase A-like enzyme